MPRARIAFIRSGRWLLPVSASKSLNAMKAFASILMLGQIAEEFYEIGALASKQVDSRHRPLHHTADG